MTRMITPTRTLIALFCAALSLFTTTLRPISRSIPPTTLSKSTGIQGLSSLSAIALVALLPQSARAIAVPEMVRGYQHGAREPNARGDRGLARRNWTSTVPDCTDSASTVAATQSGTPTGHDGVQPVTVTVTVGLPNSTYVPSPSTSGYANGTPDTNGTVDSGSTSPSTASTSSIPVTTVNPIFASAQEAQRLNLGFQSLKASDPCTPGQRGCISNQIAQCSLPASTSDTPRWVTQQCVLSSDPNQTPVCVAIPDFNANSTSTSTSTTPGAIANTTSSSSPVVLGCFNPSDITQAFDTAGLQGGFLPPGTQASAALRLIAGKEVSVGALLALIVAALL